MTFSSLNTLAVVMEKPETMVLSRLDLSEPGEEDVIVQMEWSGISTGTERLLWTGRMPPFPGLGYPLVPGYESVGRITHAGAHADAQGGREVGQRVFVPGARCFGDVRGLFGGAAAKVVVPGARVTPIDERLGEQGVLLALAATAYHAVAARPGADPATPGAGTATHGAVAAKPGAVAATHGAVAATHGELPDLIIGHGVLGRLIARLGTVLGAPVGAAPPVVWERNANRVAGAMGYEVIHPDADPRRDYRAIYDVSGDSSLLDTLIQRLAPGGEIVLAGFYSEPLQFAFPAAFMREARIRIAAEWREADLIAVKQLIESGQLSLDGLITHRQEASDAPAAYRTAFTDPSCLKMILDWRAHA